MSIQEIAVSNNQKKHLLRAITDEAVLYQEDNGDLVVDVASYLELKAGAEIGPIETIIGNDVLNFDAEYIVFS